jgi:5-methylthioadenosine/S-adenosylhomocysteine deaminase
VVSLSVGIRGSYIVGFDGSEHRMIRDGLVIVEGKRIKHIGKSYDGTVEKWIDASGCLVMPGLINTHLHASTAPKDKSFLEDIGIRQLYGSNLGENLTALGASATKEDLQVYARYSLNECLLSGNTTVVEIGMIPSLGEEVTCQMIGDIGIRAYEGHVIGDGAFERVDRFDFRTRWLNPEVGTERLAEAVSFIERYDGAHGGRLKGAIYPSSPLNTSLRLMGMVKEAADKLDCPVSMHAGEWVLEFQNMLRMYGKTPVEVIEESGLLSKRLIIGHGWAVSGHPLLGYPARGGGDLSLLAESGATVSHDPVVFVKRGNRLHSHSAFLRAGVNVSIGTDTAPQDMLNEMRIASYVSKLADWDYSSGTSREIFDSATLRGAKALGRADIGRLAKGALADITIVDMTTINNVPCRDPIRNIVNSTQRSDVRLVMVDGDVLAENGKLVREDERSLAKEVQRVSESIYDRLPDNHPFKRSADEVSPPSLRSWEGESP